MVRILELQTDLNPRFRLEKSNITKEESATLATKEASALSEEIAQLQEKLSKDDASVADLEREYDEKLSRYTALNAAWYPENPELN